MSLVRKSGKKAMAIGICSFSIPLILNIMLDQFLTFSTPMELMLHSRGYVALSILQNDGHRCALPWTHNGQPRHHGGVTFGKSTNASGILAPIVKFSYKPLERYTGSKGMTIQYANPFVELRLLACMHYEEHTPSVINLFEASYPNPKSPICFYVIRFLELVGRSAPVLMAHHPGMRDPFISHASAPIINALKLFESEKKGDATVYPFTAISPYAEMHDTVCSLAAEKKVSLVIVLFHRHPHILVTKGESTAIRVVNHNIIKNPHAQLGF
ncbi:UNVERIFIED_CONTAM: Cation/H(+) antiporter 14 [Sesamum radiatum]|uniref:Cation/H(+) antiporter 14 n=1 Tax=Sesamum radiatum TaxID=300843 RepID=A0AAW2VZC6_SESRA